MILFENNVYRISELRDGMFDFISVKQYVQHIEIEVVVI